jgi:peptidoglycan/xylan/chitin deacetylase (PgdA/CDA1 family)
VSLTELCNTLIKGENIRENTIAITFDDGYKDNYLNAYPILKKYNVTATIFLVTGYIGTGNLFWWDKVSYVIHNTTLERLELDSFGIYPLKTTQQRSLAVSVIIERLKGIQDGDKNSVIEELISISGVDIPSNLGKELILSWAEVREMAKNGIDFGAHTVNHPILTRLPLEEARKEIIESKKCMEDELDRPVNAFSYPNGGPTDFNEDIKKIIKDSGFFCAVTDAPPKLVVPGTDLYELGRIAPGWDLGTLQLCISGLYPDLVTMWSRVSRVHR